LDKCLHNVTARSPRNRAQRGGEGERAVTSYIELLLERTDSRINFIRKAPHTDTQSKLSAAIWFQAVSARPELLNMADFAKHTEVLKHGSLGKIVKDTPLFKALSEKSCQDAIQKTKQGLHASQDRPLSEDYGHEKMNRFKK
jgi:hypothetical protein